MKNKGLIFGLLGFVAVFVMWFIAVNNSLVSLEANVDKQWANIESKLQRRYDLIPNLVSSVEGSMKQEQEVFGNIAKARENYSKANTVSEKVEASSELDQSVGTMISVINESYPELSSNDNVKTLMTQLEGTENRISVERDRYNQEVSTYNVAIKKFPNSIIANMSGHQPKPLFESVEEAKTAPKVELNKDKK